MDIGNKYNILVESLKLLAASFEEQRNLLSDFADITDDVISSFENAFLLLPEIIESGKLDNISISYILRTFNWMSWSIRNADLDDFSSKEWDKVRNLAREALVKMNIQI